MKSTWTTNISNHGKTFPLCLAKASLDLLFIIKVYNLWKPLSPASCFPWQMTVRKLRKKKWRLLSYPLNFTFCLKVFMTYLQANWWEKKLPMCKDFRKWITRIICISMSKEMLCCMWTGRTNDQCRWSAVDVEKSDQLLTPDHNISHTSLLYLYFMQSFMYFIGVITTFL